MTIHVDTLSSANRTVTLSHIKIPSTLSIILFLTVAGKGTGMIKTTDKHWPTLQQFAIGATDKIFIFIRLQWSIFLPTCPVTPWTDKSLTFCANNFYTLNYPYLMNNFLSVCSKIACNSSSVGRIRKKNFAHHLIFSMWFLSIILF